MLPLGTFRIAVEKPLFQYKKFWLYFARVDTRRVFPLKVDSAETNNAKTIKKKSNNFNKTTKHLP